MEAFAAEIRKAVVRIKVVGVGGGGNNVLLRMAEDKIPGIELVAVNTDAKQLAGVQRAGIEAVQIGERRTKGRGTGGVPETGAQAAQDDIARLERALRDADLVFVTAGLGGGVGTGASPVIARLLRKLGALSVGVVTTPFSFEGKRKQRAAEAGIAAMREEMDALIVVHNDNLMKLPENRRMTLLDSFRAADGVLRQAILCIAEVILTTGIVNVDFADVVSIFRQNASSDALLGLGQSESGHVTEAVQRAFESPLVERPLAGARGVILNISGNESLSLFEVSEAMQYVSDHTHPDVNIIFGMVVDASLKNAARATLVATDFADSAVTYRPPRPRAEQPVSPAARRRPQPGRRPAQPNGGTAQTVSAAPRPMATEEPARGKDALSVPDFMDGRRAKLPPLILHTDDGRVIPPFQPRT